MDILELLSALHGGARKANRNTEQLLSWILLNKFKGRLVLSAEEFEDMQNLNHVRVVGLGIDDDGLTIIAERMKNKRESERCADCGRVH